MDVFNQNLRLICYFHEKVPFLTFSHCSIPKKGSKNPKTKGVTLEVFVDFGHF